MQSTRDPAADEAQRLRNDYPDWGVMQTPLGRWWALRGPGRAPSELAAASADELRQLLAAQVAAELAGS